MKRLALLLWLCLAAPAAAAAPSGAPADELIHSDLPLWIDEYAVMWPRSYEDAEEIGCTHNIQLGDWRYREPVSGAESWVRLNHYGVFNCLLVEQRSVEPTALAGASIDYSFLIDLGAAAGRNGPVELWALQSGSRPGSDYTLLARKAEPGVIRTFDVLQRQCPQARLRAARAHDILITRYCAINSQAELKALAQRMAALPPLGVLEFVRVND